MKLESRSEMHESDRKLEHFSQLANQSPVFG